MWSGAAGRRLATSFLLAVCAAPELRAQDRFWDPTRTSGDWNTTAAIWGTTAGGPFTSTWVNGAGANLNAAPGGSTATLTTAVSTNFVFGFSGNFTIAAGSGGSLTFTDNTFVGNTSATGTTNLLINTPILGDQFVQFINFGGGTAGIYLNADNTFSFPISVGGNTRLGIGTADPAAGPVRSGTLSGDVSVDFAGVLSFQSTQTYAGVVTGFTTSRLEVVSPPVGVTTLTLTRTQIFGGTVQLADNSTLALANNGSTTFGSVAAASQLSLSRNATLDVTAHTGGTWTLSSGQTLTTAGTAPADGGRILGTARVEGTLALTGEAGTGGGVLRQEGGTLALAGGATWRTNLTSWTGTTPGEHFSQISGVGGAKLDLSSASSSNRITLDVRSQSLTGFDPAVGSSWAVADFSAGNASGGIVGFAPDKFLIDTSSFGQALSGGSFSLTTDAGTNVVLLNFTPVPESAAGLVAAAAGLGLVGLARGRFRGTSGGSTWCGTLDRKVRARGLRGGEQSLTETLEHVAEFKQVLQSEVDLGGWRSGG
jgi:hypothetical protein